MIGRRNATLIIHVLVLVMGRTQCKWTVHEQRDHNRSYRRPLRWEKWDKAHNEQARNKIAKNGQEMRNIKGNLSQMCRRLLTERYVDTAKTKSDKSFLCFVHLYRTRFWIDLHVKNVNLPTIQIWLASTRLKGIIQQYREKKLV